MGRYLYTVENVFSINCLGTGLVGFALEQYGLFKKGDIVELRRPDGSMMRVSVAGVEYPPGQIWRGERRKNPRYSLIVSAEKSDVPVGTEVWSVDQ